MFFVLFCFFSSHVQMWELDHKECFWSVVLEKTLEGPLHCREITPVNPKGNQHRISIGRTDAKAEAPNTLATWCEDLTLEKILMLRKIEGKKKGTHKGGDVDSITDSMDMNLSKLREVVEDRGAWCAAVHGVTRSQTGFSNWTTATIA